MGGEGLVRPLEQALRDWAAERSCETLLSAQNLRSVMKEPQPYVLNILPRRLPEEVVAGEHFVLQDLPFYTSVQEVDARTRKARLIDREDKRKEGLLRKAPGGKLSAPSPAGAPAKKKGKVTKKGKEVKIPTPPKEFVCPPITYKKEVTIKEPENPLSSFISSGPGHVAGLNHSGSSLSAAARLAILAEEAASINTPDSPHPDADAGEAVRADASPLMATPMEEMGAESQGLASCEPSPFALVPVKGPVSRRSSSARNLKSGLIGWLQDCFQETIEVGCSSVQDDHPEGSETEMATETPAVPVVVPDEGTPGETHPAVNEGGPVPEEESPSNASSGESLVDDAACISADSFSYAELEEKLKWIPPGSTTAMPSAKMFEVVETV